MSNLGQREKYMMILFGVMLVIFAMYMFGIRPLQTSYEALSAERAQLEQQKAYLDSLKSQNDEAAAAIDSIKEDISDVEKCFIPVIKTEALEQYVLSVFEENGCPYLANVSSSDIATPEVILPDGSVSQDKLLIKRVSVTYSTTDGFNIPQYNQSNTVVFDGIPDQDAFDAMLEQMVWEGTEKITGYDEFLAALHELADENDKCIKVTSVSIESKAGYILMSAEIDFFAGTFTNRISAADFSAPYSSWAGATSVNTDGGFVGCPFIVDNSNSAWYNTLMSDSDAVSTSRPFATYYSNEIFTDLVNANGLVGTLGIDEEGNIMQQSSGASDDADADVADADADADVA